VHVIPKLCRSLAEPITGADHTPDQPVVVERGNVLLLRGRGIAQSDNIALNQIDHLVGHGGVAAQAKCFEHVAQADGQLDAELDSLGHAFAASLALAR
jgi:hypothetical protein